MYRLLDHHMISEIARLHTLQSRIRQTAVDRDNSLEGYLEQLPYALGAAAYSAIGLSRAQEQAVESVRARATGSNAAIQTYQLESHEYDAGAYAIDNFLDAARRAQNSIWPYLSKVLKQSVPQSLSRLAMQVESGSSKLPPLICDLIRLYWDRSGRSLKEYRDLAQHHAVVSSDGRVTLMPDGRAGIYLVLPNNPTAKDAGRLKYIDPRIDAVPYVWNTYWTLYAFVSELCHILLSFTASASKEELAVFRFKGALTLGGRIEACGVVVTDDVISNFVSLQNQLRKQLDEQLPRIDIAPTLVVPSEDSTGTLETFTVQAPIRTDPPSEV
jgi:hypothetical protein